MENCGLVDRTWGVSVLKHWNLGVSQKLVSHLEFVSFRIEMVLRHPSLRCRFRLAMIGRIVWCGREVRSWSKSVDRRVRSNCVGVMFAANLFRGLHRYHHGNFRRVHDKGLDGPGSDIWTRSSWFVFWGFDLSVFIRCFHQIANSVLIVAELPTAFA